MIKILLILTFSNLAGCGSENNHFSINSHEVSVAPFNHVKADLAFICKCESIPEADAEVDRLFQYARWLQKNNVLIPDELVDAEIERLYRVAAEHKHYKANINLQLGGMRGRFKVGGTEQLRFSQVLIDAGVATGYFFTARALERGAWGLKQDPEMALRYYRKAADDGSAEAQAFLGEKLYPVDLMPAVGLQMLRCAADQGHGESALGLGIHRKVVADYNEALFAFQLGVAAGNDTSAGFLEEGFRGPAANNALHYLGLAADPERAERYKIIGKLLSDWYYAKPKVPEINDIVPLPPAPLPEWNGKLQWVEERLANVPPEKPSEELIKRLADEKLLMKP